MKLLFLVSPALLAALAVFSGPALLPAAARAQVAAVPVVSGPSQAVPVAAVAEPIVLPIKRIHPARLAQENKARAKQVKVAGKAGTPKPVVTGVGKAKLAKR